MATDATGTPTAKGIPKFNTAVDPASGKGTNAMMDAIDLLFDGYAAKPSGIVSGEVPVWNGSTWVRSSVTRIGASSLGSGSPSSSTFLRGDGTWAAAGSATIVTSLPGSPSDKDLIILTDSLSAPTYRWQFIYNASSASSYKWEFIGGPAYWGEIATSETSSSSSYTNLATTGPDFTTPVAGDWLITATAWMAGPTDNGGAGQALFISYDVGATGASDTWGAAIPTGSSQNDGEGTPMMTYLHTGYAASTLIRAKYRRDQNGTASNGTWKYRRIMVQPVRVG